ncbi:MAG: site-specific recombinase XerD [Candidatus Paceibacteria bacterium]|jgi:site-specific recombinase XerD
MQLVKLKRQFLEYLETERGRSVKTIENYDRYLERFIVFTKVKNPSDLTEEQVLEFRLYLNRQPGTMVDGHMETMKRRTQNYYLIALRAFLKFIRKRSIETLSPERIELVKVPERSLDLISAQELKRLTSAPDKKTLEGKRDKTILELLISTGLRVSELCGLSISDVDLSRSEFSIHGKRGKIRVVSISDNARTTIQDYLKHRKDMDTALFIRYGRKMNDGGDLRLAPRAVQRLLKKYATQAGITRKVTPHVIRHSLATNLLKNGADLRSVQVLLGHANIGTTQVYTHVTDKYLREVHKKFHGK